MWLLKPDLKTTNPDRDKSPAPQPPGFCGCDRKEEKQSFNFLPAGIREHSIHGILSNSVHSIVPVSESIYYTHPFPGAITCPVSYIACQIQAKLPMTFSGLSTDVSDEESVGGEIPAKLAEDDADKKAQVKKEGETKEKTDNVKDEGASEDDEEV
jgi:hypothetical protein